jgi:hypothetical protein
LLTPFDGLYEAMRDGNGNVLPRDLINFVLKPKSSKTASIFKELKNLLAKN